MGGNCDLKSAHNTILLSDHWLSEIIWFLSRWDKMPQSKKHTDSLPLKGISLPTPGHNCTPTPNPKGGRLTSSVTSSGQVLAKQTPTASNYSHVPMGPHSRKLRTRVSSWPHSWKLYTRVTRFAPTPWVSQMVLTKIAKNEDSKSMLIVNHWKC